MEEEYVAEMDSECLNQDFDDVDLYGEKLIEDEDDDCDVEFEWAIGVLMDLNNIVVMFLY